MLVIAILLLVVKLFFQIRGTAFEFNKECAISTSIVVIVTLVVLYVILTMLTYDKKEKEKYERIYNEPKEPSGFFDNWSTLYDDSAPLKWGIPYGIIVLLVAVIVLVCIKEGKEFKEILGILAFIGAPMVMYDIFLMLELKKNYYQYKFKYPFVIVWLFEVICCFITIGCLIALAIMLAIIAIMAFLGTMYFCLIAIFPIISIIGWFKDD